MTGSQRADALVAAAETLDALQIDQSFVIDPFAAIEQLGLTLSIAKLGNLLGAVVPRGTGGVLITSERSPAIQRYTAAHEIGHWILHERQLQVDSETEVLGRPTNEMERQAQLFAGYFLMPPALLNRTVASYGLRRDGIAPEQVYRLSRDLDVSYEATARRLHADRLINDFALSEILEFGRIRAMQRASAGHRPADGLADVWDATSDEEVVTLVVEEHDEVLVGLPEQRLAGWSWLTDMEIAERDSRSTRPRRRPSAPPPPDPAALQRLVAESQSSAHGASAATSPGVADTTAADESRPPAALVHEAFAADDEEEKPGERRRRRRHRRAIASDTPATPGGGEPLVGGNGLRTFIVRATAPGDWTLRLYYAHAYDPQQEPLLSYELQLTIQPTPNTAFRIQRLASDLDLHLPGDPDDDTEFEVA